MGSKIISALFLAVIGVVQAAEKTNTVTGAGLSGFSLDGTLKPVLTLVRGHSYQFNGNGTTTTHPFKLSLSSAGGAGTSTNTAGVTGAQPICGASCAGTSFIFTPDANTPDLLYYQCNVHSGLGNQIRIVNPPQQTSITQTDGLIGITFTNAYSSTVAVQRATDLFSNDWFTIQSITTTPGQISVLITNGLPVEHYRLTTPLP